MKKTKNKWNTICDSIQTYYLPLTMQHSGESKCSKDYIPITRLALLPKEDHSMKIKRHQEANVDQLVFYLKKWIEKILKMLTSWKRKKLLY